MLIGTYCTLFLHGLELLYRAVYHFHEMYGYFSGSKQIVNTKIRLPVDNRSDKSLYCLQIPLHPNVYYSKFDKGQSLILFAGGPAYLIPKILR